MKLIEIYKLEKIIENFNYKKNPSKSFLLLSL